MRTLVSGSAAHATAKLIEVGEVHRFLFVKERLVVKVHGNVIATVGQLHDIAAIGALRAYDNNNCEKCSIGEKITDKEILFKVSKWRFQPFFPYLNNHVFSV